MSKIKLGWWVALLAWLAAAMGVFGSANSLARATCSLDGIGA